MSESLLESSVIIDDFLPQEVWERFRAELDSADFSPKVNPADGVSYPDILIEIPDDVLSRVREVTGEQAMIFVRRSLKGTPCPHQAHNDALMGKWSLMLYLNREEHCRGGTSLVEHKIVGMREGPVTELDLLVWERDTNNPKYWNVWHQFDMKPNRAVVFPSCLMHRAEPVGGFGTSNYDGRMVLTGFF